MTPHLGREVCAYPVRGLDEGDHWWCGRPAADGSPYCTEHAAHIVMLQRLANEAKAGSIQHGWKK